MEADIFHLNLISPIFVLPMENLDPFTSPIGGNGGDKCAAIGSCSGAEKVFCFKLDEAEYLAFEPDQAKLLGTLPESLVFGGISSAGEEGAAAGKEKTAGKTTAAEIPKGNYLFAQKRKILSKEEIIEMAVEIQMEGLWQRHKPGRFLYLRYLFEDGSWVTQLYRPFT